MKPHSKILQNSLCYCCDFIMDKIFRSVSCPRSTLKELSFQVSLEKVDLVSGLVTRFHHVVPNKIGWYSPVFATTANRMECLPQPLKETAPTRPTLLCSGNFKSEASFNWTLSLPPLSLPPPLSLSLSLSLSLTHTHTLIHTHHAYVYMHARMHAHMLT